MREQHALPGAVNSLFAPTLESRMKLFVTNPLFMAQNEELQTPNHTMVENSPPLLSSTPFNGLADDITILSTPAAGVPIPQTRQSITSFNKHHPVDMIVKNPLFGSGLCFKKVKLSTIFRLPSSQVAS